MIKFGVLAAIAVVNVEKVSAGCLYTWNGQCMAKDPEDNEIRGADCPADDHVGTLYSGHRIFRDGRDFPSRNTFHATTEKNFPWSHTKEGDSGMCQRTHSYQREWEFFDTKRDCELSSRLEGLCDSRHYQCPGDKHFDKEERTTADPANKKSFLTGEVTFYQEGEYSQSNTKRLTLDQQSTYETQWGSEFRGDNRIHHVMSCPDDSTTCALSCCPSVDPAYAAQDNQEWTCKDQLQTPKQARHQCQSKCACNCQMKDPTGTDECPMTGAPGRVPAGDSARIAADQTITGSLDSFKARWLQAPAAECSQPSRVLDVVDNVGYEVKFLKNGGDAKTFAHWVDVPSCTATLQRDFDDAYFYCEATLDDLKAAPTSYVKDDPIVWRVRAFTSPGRTDGIFESTIWSHSGLIDLKDEYTGLDILMPGIEAAVGATKWHM